MARAINTVKSSALNNISSNIVKLVVPVLADQFAHLFNCSIEQSIFPQKWKEATVVPIPKPGDRTQISNYRPISLLPLPGKILEKIIHSQLSSQLESAHVLSECQHGFRKRHSTSHAFYQLINQIYTNNDKGFPTLAVFIDFKKAFDCVQHKQLLNKIKSLNTGQKLVNWSTDYLDNRKQKVLANNELSSVQTITNGVPQGSILSPLYYIIYANDIPHIISQSEVIQYADDTVLLSNNPNYDQACLEIQAGLSQLENWCSLNGISVNPKKSKAMLFGTNNQLARCKSKQIYIDNCEIEYVSTYTYLGMLLDKSLSLENHLQKVIQRTTAKMVELRKMRRFLNTQAALMVYKSMILPIIEYGNIFLGACSLDSRKKLQSLQNKSLRCALSEDKYSNVDELHKKANKNKLAQRRNKQTILFMYTQSRKLVKHKKENDTSQVRTRSGGKLNFRLRKPRTEKFRKSISYKGKKLWNSLDKELQHVPDHGAFKHRIKAIFKQKIKGMIEEDQNA